MNYQKFINLYHACLSNGMTEEQAMAWIIAVKGETKETTI